MKRSFLVLIATLALMLGLSASASAATADSHASCSGLAGAFRAGTPGATASDVHGVIANHFPPGAAFSEFSQDRLGTAEICFD